MKNLGKKAKDKVTGFTGIIIAKVTYLYGCAQYGLNPEAVDNKTGEINYFDVGRIEIIGDGVTALEVTDDEPGAENRNDSPR